MSSRDLPRIFPVMIIYGRNVVREALSAAVPLKEAVLLDSGRRLGELDGLEKDLVRAGVPVSRVGRERLEAVSHTRDHQGVAARLRAFPYSDFSRVLTGIAGDPFVILLDRVQDPHNVGAIIRTAAAAGADLVVLSEHGGCRITPAVLKTSAGCAFAVPIAVETNLVSCVRRLREVGVWVYGAAMEGDDCFQVDFSGGAGLVFGNEGGGMKRLLRENCDRLVSVPMAGSVESLNVSVAAAVISFQVLASRRREAETG